MRRSASTVGAFAALLCSFISVAAATPLVSGDILVATGDGIVQVDPTTGAHSIFSPFVADDIDWGAGAIVAIRGNTVVQIDPVTGAVATISSGGLLDRAAQGRGGGSRVAIGPTGDVFVPLDPINTIGDGLIKLNAKTGTQTLLVPGGLEDSANDVSVRPDGKVLVVTEIDRIYTIDPDTGAFTAFGDDHLRGVDVSTDGLLELQFRGIQIAAASRFFTLQSPPPLDFGDVGLLDLTWGLYDHLFFATDLGVFELDRFGPSSPFNYRAITHDVHGRLTAFIPFPATLILLSCGLAGIAGAIVLRKGRNS